MQFQEIAGLVASSATALALVVAVVQLHYQGRLAKARFEEDLVRRYWDILDRLSLDALRGGTSEPTETDLRATHAYFKLADEQIWLHSRGKIRESTGDPGLKASRPPCSVSPSSPSSSGC